VSPDEIKTTILRSLRGVAPDADPAALRGDEDLRDALDIDSMDFLRFVVDLHDELHVDIPEQDYPKMRTLDACVAYVGSKLARA
jgi:acyl carrier protein